MTGSVCARTEDGEERAGREEGLLEVDDNLSQESRAAVADEPLLHLL